MDHCVSHQRTFTLPSLPSSPISKSSHSLSSSFAARILPGQCSIATPLSAAVSTKRWPLSVVASAGKSSCQFSSLNSPLEPRSAVGKLLSRVLQNHRQFFHVTVADELKHLAKDLNEAVTREVLSAGSDEAFLHRRIALLKEHECQVAVQDVMYMLIFYKFSEIRVPLVPKLSRCVYNGRLEILPSRDWELESIYDSEVLTMIKEHVSTAIGLRVDSSVKENWAMTNIPQAQLGRVYVASILYGYFLKAATLRHNLECNLVLQNQNHLRQRTSLKFQEMCLYGFKNFLFGRHSSKQSVPHGEALSTQEMTRHENLKCFLMGFDSDALQRCAKLKTEEAANLVESHSRALFGNEETGSLETDEVILTSFSSLKRLVLEAVAFGSFLWDTEEYVNSVYKLKES